MSAKKSAQRRGRPRRSPEVSGPKGDFGRRIRQLRDAAGLTQGDLARASKLSKVYLGTLERGEKEPSLGSIMKLAAGLNVPAPELLRFDAPVATRARARPTPTEKLVRKLASLTLGSSESKLARFERIARAFFEDDDPSPGSKRRRH